MIGKILCKMIGRQSGNARKLPIHQWIPSFTSDVLKLLDLRLTVKVLGKLAEAGKDSVKREELIALLMS
jgi:hypothetical protein